VEDKATLMRKLGKKQLTLELSESLDGVPPAVAGYDIALANEGRELVYTYDTKAERTGITTLLEELKRAGVGFKDLRTTQSSLEDIFVDLTSR
jgi:ABC-2 type transport system ATP-binding protein